MAALIASAAELPGSSCEPKCGAQGEDAVRMHAENFGSQLCAFVICWMAIDCHGLAVIERGANLGCRTEAREELRRQIGTLRFDLSSLAAGLDKPKRKEAARLQKDFFKKVKSFLCS